MVPVVGGSAKGLAELPFWREVGGTSGRMFCQPSPAILPLWQRDRQRRELGVTQLIAISHLTASHFLGTCVAI